MFLTTQTFSEIRFSDSVGNGAFHAFLLRLSPSCRRARFGANVSDEFTLKYALAAGGGNNRLFGAFADGVLIGVAELVGVRTGASAEAAFCVQAEFQNIGIGSELMARVIAAARRAGVARITIDCDVFNRRMQRVAVKAGRSLEFADGGCMTVISIGLIAPSVERYVLTEAA